MSAPRSDATLWVQWMFVGLLVWGVGVEVNEGLASVGLGLCALAACVDLVRRGELRSVARRSAPVLAYVGWCCLGALLVGRSPTGTGISRALEWVAVPLGAWALRAVGPERRNRVAAVIAAGFLLSCLAAGLQSFGVWPPLSALAPLRFTRIPFQHVYEPVQGSAGRFMGGGLLFHRLKFAHVGAITVLFALPHAVRASGRTRAAACAVSVLGALSVLLFPYARAAVVALALSAAVVGVLAARRTARAALVGGALVLAIAAAAFSSPGLRGRFSASLSGEGSGHRTQLWASGWNAVKASPIAGVGAGRFVPQNFAAPGTSPEVLELKAKAHNQFLTVAAETGWVGLALFLWMLASFVRPLLHARRSALGALGAIAFFVLISMLHDPLFHPVVAMALMLALAGGLADVGAAEPVTQEAGPAPEAIAADDLPR